jgi:hypothetical protein
MKDKQDELKDIDVTQLKELPYDVLLGENITMKKKIVELEEEIADLNETLDEYRKFVKW